MGVAKVIIDDTTIVDMTDATASASELFKNYTAYGADGEKIIGKNIANTYITGMFTHSKTETLEWTLPENAVVNLGYMYATNVIIHGNKYISGTNPSTNITGIISFPDAIQIQGNAWVSANFSAACVYCPKVTTIGPSFLIGANAKTNLVKIVIAANPWNASNSIRNSGKLKAVVIKAASVPSLSQSSAISNSGIGQNADGYIYVPQSLIDLYKSDTNWSVFSTKFRTIEDYPLIDAPDTWLPQEDTQE